MAKGTFGTPRSIGTVEEIHVTAVSLSRKETGEYFIDADFLEGNDVSGVIVETEVRRITIEVDALAEPDQVFFNNFLKMLISEYVGDRGYSGVVIT